MFNGAFRHATFGAGAIAAVAGLVTAFASPTVLTNFTAGTLNGANAAALKAKQGPARTVSVTTSASASTYNTGANNPIVVTGTRAGKVVSESLLLTAAGGGETIKGVQLFDSITNVAVPAQQSGAGSMSIGVNDVGGPGGKPFTGFRPAAAGTVNVQFQDGSTDVMTVFAGVGEPSSCERVLATTAIGVCVYFE